MKHLEVSGAVRPLYGSLGVKGLMLYIMHKYNAGNQTKRIGLGRTCNKRGKDEKCFYNFVGKTYGITGKNIVNFQLNKTHIVNLMHRLRISD